MIRDGLEFRTELEKINKWWFTNSVEEAKLYPLKREQFETLKKELQTPRINIVVGPRRVGKSILVKQAIEYLIQNGENPRNILYYSLDDPTLSVYSDNLLKDLIDYFLENIALPAKKYIFLDEIHLFTGWHKRIKAFYDRRKDIKFVLSGSSSTSLEKEINIFLRGRTFEIEMFPLSFFEFTKFSGIKMNKIEYQELLELDEFKVRKIQHNLKNVFNEYLAVGGFPEWFEMKNQSDAKLRWFTMLIEDIPKKAIYEDIATLFGIRNAKILEQVFAFITAHQSRLLSYETINDIVKLDRSTLINYLEFLKSSYLVAEVLKFASIKEQIKAKKKFLVIDQGLRNAVLKDYEVKEDNLGFILENVVGINLFLFCKRNDMKLYYWRINDEVDFIISDKEVIPVEVKYKKRIGKNDKSKLKNFMRKFKKNRAFLITKDLYGQERVGKSLLYFIPAEVFLLSL